MSEIAFMSNVRIMRGVDLSADYEHTYYFGSLSEQTAFFQGKTWYSLSEYSYQRHTRNSIKVGILCDKLLGANYMMFNNEAFGTKWFYAFIKDIEYVNNNTSIIYYQIDYMQTYLFDMKLTPCFVERGHTATDEKYSDEMRVSEDIAYGDLLAYGRVFREGNNANNWMYILFATSQVEEAGNMFHNTVHNNVFNGLYWSFHPTPELIAEVVDAYINAGVENDIIAIFQIPYSFTIGKEAFSFQIDNVGTPFQGYVPNNNKLYSYPYNRLVMYNNQGQSNELKFENFSNPKLPTFACAGAINPSPSAKMWPTFYAGVGDNFWEGLTIDSFPTCACAGDAFKAWFAQNKAANATSVLAGALPLALAGDSLLGGLGGVGLAAAASPIVPAVGIAAGVAAGASLISKVTGIIAQGQRAAASPSSYHGSLGGDGVNALLGLYDFAFVPYSITRSMAKIIDDYFTRFGYAIKRVQTPQTHVRQKWTYVKTVGCDVGGTLPNDAATAINACFDNGISFWVSSFDGNYATTNPILS